MRWPQTVLKEEDSYAEGRLADPAATARFFTQIVRPPTLSRLLNPATLETFNPRRKIPATRNIGSEHGMYRPHYVIHQPTSS